MRRLCRSGAAALGFAPPFDDARASAKRTHFMLAAMDFKALGFDIWAEVGLSSSNSQSWSVLRFRYLRSQRGSRRGRASLGAMRELGS